MFTLIRPKIWGGPGLPGLLGDYTPMSEWEKNQVIRF